jgi:hypothetical protein
MFPIVFGIRVLSRSVTPHNAAVLGRDQVQIRLAENGGDSTQDRCAFDVNDLKTPLAPTPTAVSCGDAPQLRQRAADERRRSDEVKSDQEKITLGTRASYPASLAIVADLT